MFLVSCAAPMVSGFNKISPGMTRAQVIENAGEPHSKSFVDGTEVFYYTLASSFLDTDGSDTRDYYASFENGRLTAYGPYSDASTIERSRRQFQGAWNAAASIGNSAPKTYNHNVRIESAP